MKSFSQYVLRARDIVLGLVCALAFLALAVYTPAFSQAEGMTVDGWAWSDTIGWIDLSTLSGNGSGDITGYAWSDNIGWVKFGGLSSFPSGAGTAAQNAQIVGGSLVGWARACAGTASGDCSSMTDSAGGWDGWISLSGTGYGVTYSGGAFGGYAWGSDVVGWLEFDAVSLCTPTTPVCSDVDTSTYLNSSCLVVNNDCSPYICAPTGICPIMSGCLSLVSPASACVTTRLIKRDSTATLYWSIVNAESCTLAKDNETPFVVAAPAGAYTTPSINIKTLYTLTCSNPYGPSIQRTATINMSPEFIEQ